MKLKPQERKTQKTGAGKKLTSNKLLKRFSMLLEEIKAGNNSYRLKTK